MAVSAHQKDAERVLAGTTHVKTRREYLGLFRHGRKAFAFRDRMESGWLFVMDDGC
jgi:hypothetical protein